MSRASLTGGRRAARSALIAACALFASTEFVYGTVTGSISFVGVSYAGAGPGSDPFNTANWSSGALPTTGQLVFVDNGGLLELNTDATAAVDTLFLGSSAGFSGGVKVSAGTLLVNGTGGSGAAASNGLRIGANSAGTGGIGSFTQSGGTISTALSANVGIGGSGTYDLSGGTLLITQVLAVGNGDAGLSGAGTFLQSGGLVSIGQNLTVGRFNATPNKSGVGTYAMTGGSISFTSATGSLAIGGNGGVDNVGMMTVSNGRVALNGGNVNIGFGNATTASTAAGTLVLNSGATFVVPGASSIVAVGNNLATGYLELNSNASASLSGLLELGRNNGTGQVVLNDDSTLSVVQVNIADKNTSSGNGTITINGAHSTFSASGSIQFGTLGAATNRYINLNNGTLSTGSINMPANAAAMTTGARIVNMTGGTLSLSAAMGFNLVGNPATPGAITAMKLLGGTATISGGTIGTNAVLETAIPLNFNNTVALGAGTIQIDSNTVTISGTANFPAATTVSKSGAGALVISAPFTYGGGAGSINMTGGTLRLQSNGGSQLTVASNAGSTSFETQQTIAGLSIGAGATVGLNSAANTTHGVTTCSIAGDAIPTGTLDIANNNLAINYTGTSPLATTRAQVISGFHAGDWNGPGIRSSSASFSAAHPTAVGYAEASAVGLTSGLDGASTDADTIILRYTLAGDANLDRVVNSGDFDVLATKFNSAGANWSDGDFNYDGVVNALDFNLVATNFGAPVPAPTLGALVPEPSMIALIALAPLARRRRRR